MQAISMAIKMISCSIKKAILCIAACRIAGLRGGGEYVIYFILNLFLSLTVVESLMMVSPRCWGL